MCITPNIHYTRHIHHSVCKIGHLSHQIFTISCLNWISSKPDSMQIVCGSGVVDVLLNKIDFTRIRTNDQCRKKKKIDTRFQFYSNNNFLTAFALFKPKSLSFRQTVQLYNVQLGKNFVSSGHICDIFCLAQPKSVF